VRVLIRTMKKITKIAGEAGANCGDRSRSVKLRALEIARAAAGQRQAEPGQARAGVRQIAQFDQPGGGTGEAVLSKRSPKE